jgi:tetratricopeptide (TPR) repeat protein
MATLPARAAEALQQKRFKEAVELFKQLVRQDPRPEWREALAAAYGGRARALAAKGMFKEAAMVLENTLTPAGLLRDPHLYATCLIREGQQPKAAAHLLHCVASGAFPAGQRAALEELTAALLVAVPPLPAPSRPDPPEAARWHELAAASREALAAWVDDAPAGEVHRCLERISLRSAFRPLRLLLKSLATLPPDPERTRRLLETIGPGSPFFPFRQAVEAAVCAGPGIDADAWHRLTPAQQAFAAETGGLPAASVQSLGRLSAAARGGPAALFAWLLKQADLPQAEVRSACLNLLPQVPDRVPQFEKSFGPLPPLQRHRVQALAAEARGDWDAAERSWSRAARLAGAAGDRTSRLSSGVIYRHLAHLAALHPEIEGDGEGDPGIFYLERSGDVDPDHIPTVLARIAYYREASWEKDWHRLADEAAQRFPNDSQILLQATQSAAARRAYRKAAGFARRLLGIDPINPEARRQMIELQLAHARKQMRAKRPDLAAKELSQAAEWDRPDAPSGLLRIARGLVALQGGDKGQAEAWLREGVALAGGGVAGWFRAVLEAELMGCAGGDARWLRKELAAACRMPPTKEPVLAVVSVLGHVEAGESKRALSALLLEMRAWLLQGSGIVWSPAEFQTLADVFVRFDAFDLLGTYARAARRREPANPEWRFHEIVARTRGNGDALTLAETDELDEMGKTASERRDFHAAKRIARFLGMDLPRPSRKGRMADDLEDNIDDAEMLELLRMVLKEMPKGAADTLRGRVGEIGRKAAVEETMDGFRSSELGAMLPEPMLRQLCEDMVTRAMGGATARKDRL